jgi:hypothetical protein
MRKKSFYLPAEYINLLEYCTLTPNIGIKGESILRSCFHRFYCNGNLSSRQYNALHDIATVCAESGKNDVLRTIKFEGKPEGLPLFARNDDASLRLAIEKKIKVDEIPESKILLNDIKLQIQIIDDYDKEIEKFANEVEKSRDSQTNLTQNREKI